MPSTITEASILGSVELGLQLNGSGFDGDDDTVSILVSVELGLQQAIKQRIEGLYRSLNPCFSGAWSSAHQYPERKREGRSVSVLVSVELGLQPCAFSGYIPCR